VIAAKPRCYPSRRPECVRSGLDSEAAVSRERDRLSLRLAGWEYDLHTSSRLMNSLKVISRGL
jgi:hypothetical protein